ncbi:uncharacterized protein LOC101240036 isoform X2 [Hydra vulgaris]|uniref:uncharacterized protein LOC101240036 isoform X2 n=1 Tax=Hydra vulgaris TaxID=6087 RepID=UPI0032EA16B3
MDNQLNAGAKWLNDMATNTIEQIKIERFGYFLLMTLVVLIFAIVVCISSKKKKRWSSENKSEDQTEIGEKKNPIYDKVNQASEFENVVLKNDFEIVTESYVHSEINSNYKSESIEALETSCSGNNMYTTIKNVPQKVEIAYAVVPLHELAEKYCVINGDIVRKNDDSRLNKNSNQIYVPKVYEQVTVPVQETIIENSGNSSYYASVSEKPKTEIKNEVQENSAGSSLYASCGPVLLTGNTPSLDNLMNLNKKEDVLHRFSLPNNHHNNHLPPIDIQTTYNKNQKKSKNKELNSPPKDQKVIHSPKEPRLSRVFRLSKKSHSSVEESVSNQPHHEVKVQRHSGELASEISQYSEKMHDFSVHQNQDHSLPPPLPSVDRLKHITEKKIRAKSKSNSISSAIDLSPKLQKHIANNDIQEDDKYSKVDEKMISLVKRDISFEISSTEKNQTTENIITLMKKDINFEISSTETNHTTENSGQIKNTEDHMQCPDSCQVSNGHISESLSTNCLLNNSDKDIIKRDVEESLKLKKDIALLYAVVDKSKKKDRTKEFNALDSKETQSTSLDIKNGICSNESSHSDFNKDSSLDSPYILCSDTVALFPSEFSDPKLIEESLIY